METLFFWFKRRWSGPLSFCPDIHEAHISYSSQQFIEEHRRHIILKVLLPWGTRLSEYQTRQFCLVLWWTQLQTGHTAVHYFAISLQILSTFNCEALWLSLSHNFPILWLLVRSTYLLFGRMPIFLLESHLSMVKSQLCCFIPGSLLKHQLALV